MSLSVDDSSSSVRKLSAAAREFVPSPTHHDGSVTMQYPTSNALIPTPPSPELNHAHAAPAAAAATSNIKDEYLQPDDAEDEEELQTFIDNAITQYGTNMSNPTLRSALLRQVEFIFSNQSMWRDAAIQEEIRRDASSSGFVSLAYLMATPKIAALTSDMKVLLEVVSQSEKLLVNADETAVRRVRPLLPYDVYKDSNRTIFVDRLPPNSTVQSVRALFERWGRVQYILRADHILQAGASGMELLEKGGLTPKASPKIKPRSLSNSDVGRVSPQLLGRRGAATPGASPLLSGMSPALSHLSPAQRNRAIAAASPALDPTGDTFTAAFIQFDKPAWCKRAVSHIVAYNKQLKAMTPKPSARRGSHGGVPSLPANTMGGHANSGSIDGSVSTPPRSRTVRISSTSSHGTTNSSSSIMLGGVQQVTPPVSPPRARLAGIDGPYLNHNATSPPPLHGAPPTHSLSPPPAMQLGVPPRHVSSPTPQHGTIGPLSSAERAVRDAVRPNRANSVTSPLMFAQSGTPQRTSAAASPLFGRQSSHPVKSNSTGGVTVDSPVVSPLPSPRQPAQLDRMSSADGHLPELSLTPTLTATAPVAPLPDEFVGMFVMPKLSYLKSLKTRPGEKKQIGGSSTTTSSHAPSSVASPALPISSVSSPSAASSTTSERKGNQSHAASLSPSPQLSAATSPTGSATGNGNGIGNAAPSLEKKRSHVLVPIGSPKLHNSISPPAITNTPPVTTTVAPSAAAPTPVVAPAREKAASPPVLTTQIPTSVTSTPAALSPTPIVSTLSASAPVFQPSSTPLMVPVIAPAPIKPTTGSPVITGRAATSGNWRTPSMGAQSATSPHLDELSHFALSPPLAGAEITDVAAPAGGKNKKNKLPKQPKRGSISEDGNGAHSSAASVASSLTAAAMLSSERTPFSLTNKRTSVSGGGAAERQVLSRFALGPLEAGIGFAGRGRGKPNGAAPSLLGAGGGKPLQ